MIFFGESMAKVIEQIVAIKLSKIVKDSETAQNVLDSEQQEDFVSNLSNLAESALNDPTVVVEVFKLD